MTLSELVSSRRPQLTEADRRLLQTLLEKPRETALLSTNALAQRAAVHPTSAVRFARKLGFKGYPALRAALQMDLFGASEAADRVRQRIERLAANGIVKPFVESEIAALRQLPEQIDDSSISAAARAILRARTAFLFATGHGGVLLRLLQTRLSRAGYHTHALAHEARDLAAGLLLARRDDVFVLVALNRLDRRISDIVAQARACRATSVLITDVAVTAGARRPDVVLAARRGASGEARSLTIPMAICNMIMVEISKQDRGKTIRNLEQLTQLSRQMGE
ncbi:MAG: MurR/RpiR family transcriptional regulator [Betaproteobacteria bacterium]